MRGKIGFVLGAAVGYVLGTRAGRERYEQIKRGAKKLWGSAPVQRQVHVVSDAADERMRDVKRYAQRLVKEALAKFAHEGEQPPAEDQAPADAAADGSDAAGSAGSASERAKPASSKPASSKSAPSKSTQPKSGKSAAL